MLQTGVLIHYNIALFDVCLMGFEIGCVFVYVNNGDSDDDGSDDDDNDDCDDDECISNVPKPLTDRAVHAK